MAADPTLDLPPTNADGSLRYYTEGELSQIGITHRGVRGDPAQHVEEDFGPDRSGGPRQFYCNWGHRYAALIVMLGYAKKYAVGDEIKISRLLPMVHTYHNFNFIATSAKVTAWRFTGEMDDGDGGARLPSFTRAKLDVNFELVPFQLLDDAEGEPEINRYVTEPGDAPGGEMQTETNVISIGGGAFKFTSVDGTSKPVGVPIPYSEVGIPETTTKKRVMWRRVPKEIWGAGKPLTSMVKGDGTPANRGYIGAINLTEIWGHPPLTLQLLGVEERLLPDPTGLTKCWDIGYIFLEKCVPYGHLGYLWNPILAADANTAGYNMVVRSGVVQTTPLAAADVTDTKSIFRVRELKNLFLPGGA